MSHSESITIACPDCKNKQPFTVWQSFDAAANPELKQQLLDRSLTTFTCQKCGHMACIEQELLYYDARQRRMIFRGQAEPESSLVETLGPAAVENQANCTLRLVATINDLAEEVLIADAGLDDRVVAVVKSLLINRIDPAQRGEDAELLFGGMFTENSETMVEFILVNESGSTSWTVPFEQTIGQCEAQLRDVLPDRETERGQWLRVDRQFAKKFIEG